MDFVNLGILAHVDAGKTSLTERLLFETGVTRRIGSVDRGDTQTDSLDLERRRGITIQSGVVAFTIGDLQVNVIDTPGHSDFVSEVDRALRVLDSAILVVSAVEGLQSRTRVLLRSLGRLQVPVMIFINKVDRMGARNDDLLASLRETVAADCVAMCTVTDIGTSRAAITPFDPNGVTFRESLANAFASHDEVFLKAYVDDPGALTAEDYLRHLREHVRGARVYPVFFGSAITGVGVDQLIGAIAGLLPRTTREQALAPLRSTVLKIERGRAGEKVAYARTHSGSFRARDKVAYFRRDRSGTVSEFTGRVSAIRVFDRGTTLREADATAGTIAKVWGLSDIQIGDQLGTPDGLPTRGLFPPPMLETIITPVNPKDRAAMFTALQRIAEQDPLIGVHQEESTGAISVFLYGEVQKEVIAATLHDTYGVPVSFEVSRTVYVEKPIGTGEALEEINQHGRNFFWATVGLRLEPGPPDSGVTFRLSVELGSLPLAFHRAIEETVYKTLQRGVYGWEVLDCAVTLTRTGYASPISAAGDFRNATPLVVGEALKQAGTRVYEPVHRFDLEIPEDTISGVLGALASVRAAPDEQAVAGHVCRIHGTLPTSTVNVLAQRVPELTRGEGAFMSEFDGYRPYAGSPPVRLRPGANPYDREQYMTYMLGRLG